MSRVSVTNVWGVVVVVMSGVRRVWLLARISGFIGAGSWKAPIWLIAVMMVNLRVRRV